MKILTAYNINIDAVHTLSGQEITELFKRRKIGSSHPRKSAINSPEDFLSWLLYFMKKGSGAELSIDGKEAVNFIESSFSWEFRMGGNAGNMANALGEMGSLAIVNVPRMSRRQASLFHPRVRVPAFKGGGLILKSPAEVLQGGEDLIHFVLMFEEGEIVIAPDETITSSRENRFIATCDPLNSSLFTDPAFDAYAKENLDEVDGALISGFHLMPSMTADGKNNKDVLDRALLRQRAWKQQRPDLYIHVELGGFESAQIMLHILHELAADSIGMNEDELSRLVRIDSSRRESIDWRGLLDAARRLRYQLGIRRICVHTRDYILSVIDDLIDPSLEVEAITYGADVAAALVSTGRVMKAPQIDGLLVSAAGARASDEFCQDYGAIRIVRGAYARRGDEAFCLTPALVARRTTMIVGIGDAMTAAAYHREMEALLEMS